MSQDCSRARILVIEDEFALMYPVIAGAIEREDRIELAWAQDLFEAEDAFAVYGETLKAVVFDGLVPDRNHTTVELARKIKQSGYTGAMICSSSLKEVKEQLIDAGCQFVCSKFELLACAITFASI